MKKTVFLKSTLRQPIRSLFILLLVGVVSFAFVSRMGEALLVNQEMEELVGYYRSIGSLVRSGSGWGHIPKQVIEYLEASPYVAYVDPRQSTSGILQDGLYNTNTNGSYTSALRGGHMAAGTNPADIFFYGTYIGTEYATLRDAQKGRYQFRVDQVLSGYPEYVTEGKSITLCVDPWEFGEQYTEIKKGERYLLRGYYPSSVVSYPVGTFLEFSWKPLASNLSWFLPATEDIDLTQPEYARFVSEMKQSHDNACALQITATADMSAMPHFQPDFVGLNSERYYLVDGRWLNYEDHLSENQVIVITQGLAAARGLAVGDTVTVKLRNLFYVESNGEAYSTLTGYQTELRAPGKEDIEPNETKTLTIVGIYDDLTWGTSYSQKNVYIPLSILPDSFTPAVASDDDKICSLVLTSPEYEEDFQDATRKFMADWGYYITFQETNYRNFKNAAEGIGTAARNNVAIFAVILAVSFCLACFVYFRFRRRDLAISRALGVPAGKCITASALPLVMVGGVGIVAGSILAWNYTQANADGFLSTLVNAAGVEGSAVTLPTTTLAVLDLALVAALLVLALGFAWVTVKRPVLSQLQGSGKRR